ncbi:MAG: hypothetical protein LBF38_05595 [Deltaproteobacteria bacterium]|jgi:hypothetical protein|nr:hypothetical protein [Deltaproteobacteria bacterium]
MTKRLAQILLSMMILALAMGEMGAWAQSAPPKAAQGPETGPETGPAAGPRPVPLPAGVKAYPVGAQAEEILQAFIGIPFRVDGVVNDQGEWATWNRPETVLKGSGFNCSGFLLEAVRHLTGRNVSIAQAIFDRDDDSGPDSELGLDWDYGLDILMNLSGATLADLIPAPESDKYQTNQAGRPEGLGLDINGPGFPDLIENLPKGLYLFAISKPDRRFKGGLSYYHVGVIHADDLGNVWIYQSTARARTHRLNLNNPAGIAAIRRYFPPIRAAQRRVVLARLNPDFRPPSPTTSTAQHPDPADLEAKVEAPKKMETPPQIELGALGELKVVGAAKAKLESLGAALAEAGLEAKADVDRPYELEVSEDTPQWLNNDLDPWTAAARLDESSTPLEGVGDGLGGEVEAGLSFGPSELGESGLGASALGENELGENDLGESDLTALVTSPPLLIDNGGAAFEKSPNEPATDKLLVRSIPAPKKDEPNDTFTITRASAPIVGTIGSKPIVVNMDAPLSGVKKVSQDLGLEKAEDTALSPAPNEGAKIEAAKILTPSIDQAALPPGQELENGVKVFTLVN